MDEDELRHLMLAAEVPPGNADVRRAMAAGRRRNRRRTLAAAGAGVAVLAAVGAVVAFEPLRAGPDAPAGPPAPTATAPAPGRCTPTLLDTPGGATGTVTAIDPGGTIAGGGLAGQPPRAILWRDGAVADLPADATGTVADVAGDTVVGYTAPGPGQSTGWVWRGGAVTTLAALDGHPWTRPHAVNAAGVVAGWVQGTAPDDTAPVTWSPDGTVRRLTLPPIPGVTGPSTARDIADDGTIAGEAHGIPVVWSPDGTPRLLPLPDGARTGTAWAVAGPFVYGSAGGVEVRWDLSVPTLTKTSTLPDTGPLGARAGTADGTALLPGDGLQRTAMRIGLDYGGPVPADRLLGPDGELAIATAISADGTTIAGTVLDGDRGRPAIWHCTD
ncbi:hypothetical protein [Spirilliplanes yamanashiensis]|uniref:Uncharacterized protein n=1 Tax=Spirilliplanes yamanashiensis TaxID=42233 RepID=A0A8J4DJ34_9ACTN|nr:hypothetical protein [Spirilliplanes yamanashiensis]MDP9815493.1 hypothetical protein [Spirilliplanes yamanashiensis]GIJ03747.1 hypothetical protein Sya03_30990 [Spirilliplanes yamanashiensis]